MRRNKLSERQLLLFLKKLEGLEDKLITGSPDLLEMHKLTTYIAKRLEEVVTKEKGVKAWGEMVRRHNL